MWWDKSDNIGLPLEEEWEFEEEDAAEEPFYKKEEKEDCKDIKRLRNTIELLTQENQELKEYIAQLEEVLKRKSSNKIDIYSEEY